MINSILSAFSALVPLDLTSSSALVQWTSRNYSRVVRGSSTTRAPVLVLIGVHCQVNAHRTDSVEMLCCVQETADRILTDEQTQETGGNVTTFMPFLVTRRQVRHLHRTPLRRRGQVLVAHPERRQERVSRQHPACWHSAGDLEKFSAQRGTFVHRKLPWPRCVRRPPRLSRPSFPYCVMRR